MKIFVKISPHRTKRAIPKATAKLLHEEFCNAILPSSWLDHGKCGCRMDHHVPPHEPFHLHPVTAQNFLPFLNFVALLMYAFNSTSSCV